MSETVIKVDDLGKCYRIGEHMPYKTIRESLSNALKNPFHRLKTILHRERQAKCSYPLPSPSSSRDLLWALRNVFFEIKQGEVVAIIGRNGAGKSTLLKILSKVTEPTQGRVALRGRVGSLLEVGTGFHPELTGHENVYLYGAILGMARREITRKFDEIVSFAELEKFIQTPVKRYSSGMYMRLAFAVAAHLEPDILLVDEILAVGDTAFQKKCLGKIDHVSRKGRTVLFVSHNMGAVSQLCSRAFLLDRGCLIADGKTESVIARYLQDHSTPSASVQNDWDRQGTQKVRVTSIRLLDEKGHTTQSILMGRDLKITIAGQSQEPGFQFNFSIQVVSELNIPILFLYDQYIIFQTSAHKTFQIEAVLPALRLMPGMYFLHLWLGREGMEEYDYVKHVARFDVIQSEAARTTHPLGQQYGFINEPFVVRQVD